MGQVVVSGDQNSGQSRNTKDLAHLGANAGFYGTTPIAQGATVADASGGATVDAEARTALNDLLARVRALGLIAT